MPSQPQVTAFHVRSCPACSEPGVGVVGHVWPVPMVRVQDSSAAHLSPHLSLRRLLLCASTVMSTAPPGPGAGQALGVADTACAGVLPHRARQRAADSEASHGRLPAEPYGRKQAACLPGSGPHSVRSSVKTVAHVGGGVSFVKYGRVSSAPGTGVRWPAHHS